MRLVSTVILAALLLSASPVAAQSDGNRVDPAVVQRALDYLNSVRTLSAKFVQRDQAGGLWTGQLWLARPGRLRFQYDPPESDVIWSSGGLVKHYDAALEAMTHLPPDWTPAWFLLDDHVRIDGDVTLLATAENGERFFVTAAQSTAVADARVTLAFAKNPERILGWTVTDDSGAVSQLELRSMQVGVEIPDDVFQYQPPVGDFRD